MNKETRKNNEFGGKNIRLEREKKKAKRMNVKNIKISVCDNNTSSQTSVNKRF